ncbi:MAG: hypothetical protein WAW96_12260, partial [Alphaproteobacteria bacterium]
YGAYSYSMADVMDYGGVSANYTAVQALYTIITAISILLFAGSYGRIRRVMAEYRSKRLGRIKVSGAAIAITLGLLTLHFISFCFAVDWQTLWSHEVYLSSLSDPGMVSVLGAEIVATIIRTTSLWAIVAALCFLSLATAGDEFLKIWAAGLATFYFIVLFALHSRSAIFVPSIIAGSYYVMRLRSYRVVTPALGLTSFISLVGALQGRSTDNHGLSSVFSTIARVFTSGVFSDVLTVLGDLCQGIFVTAESLQIREPFKAIYRNLAFSPLPSMIDGYDKIRSADEHRVHVFVPMAGIAEAIHFGWPYLVLLCFVFLIVVRVHAKLISKNPTVFLLCNFLLLIAAYLLFSYPIRNALRYAWIAFALSVVLLLFKSHRSRGAARARLKAVQDSN